MEELRFIGREGVWKPAATSEAKAASGRPPVATRWVISVKRGDTGERIVRARLVAKGFRPMVGVKERSRVTGQGKEGSGSRFLRPCHPWRSSAFSLHTPRRSSRCRA